VPGTHLIWLHDPAARYEDRVMPGPFTVVAGARQMLATFTATTMGVDPNEPNPSAALGTPAPAGPWASSGALIGPVGQDVDVYCLDSLAGDRLVISTSTRVLVAGELRSHPWIDPMLGWISVASGQWLATNDDSPQLPASLDAHLETVVETAGRYCAVVTTYGDSDFDGSGQASAGRYTLQIESGILFADGFE
jgi:hypothetical protein